MEKTEMKRILIAAAISIVSVGGACAQDLAALAR